jgi:FtsP/CotA-like multicopper oxidase with cupredoxin domain
MRHPIHFHGHFFMVLNGKGEYEPFKNTLDIMPMETDILEFIPAGSGDCFFHCDNKLRAEPMQQSLIIGYC